MIETLTPEQEALIPVYREKWKLIALSTEPIASHKSAVAVKVAYTLIGKKEPYILFCDSPNAASNTWLDILLFCNLSQLENPGEPELSFRNRLQNSLGSELISYLVSQADKPFESVKSQLVNQLEKPLWLQLRGQLEAELVSQLESQLVNQLYNQLQHLLPSRLTNISAHDAIQPEFRVCTACWLDFCISVLNCPHKFQQEWKVFQLLIRDCGWIFPYKNICLICERSIQMSFDNQQCVRRVTEEG